MTQAGSMARLVALDGDVEGQIFELQLEETMIGRNPSMDIAIPDDGISREHAIISYEEPDAEFVIEDLQSTNGTKVNGKRVRSATLSAGDQLRIGHTTFRFELAVSPSGG
ncbi:MAG: FHA domain-containing protein [Myxococcota bacterium]|nr:FHA domain-containing protein [Myxococcota bacterium]